MVGQIGCEDILEERDGGGANNVLAFSTQVGTY